MRARDDARNGAAWMDAELLVFADRTACDAPCGRESLCGGRGGVNERGIAGLADRTACGAPCGRESLCGARRGHETMPPINAAVEARLWAALQIIRGKIWLFLKKTMRTGHDCAMMN